MAGALREENARLWEEDARLAERDAEEAAELGRMRAALAVLKRMLVGRSSERSRAEPGAGDDGAGGGVRKGGPGGSGKNKRGPGARAGRRDYSHLPRFKVVWEFEGGGVLLPEGGEPFKLLGGHITGVVGLVVVGRAAAYCPRREPRDCPRPR